MGVGFTLLGLAAAVLALIAGYKYYERRRQSSSLSSTSMKQRLVHWIEEAMYHSN